MPVESIIFPDAESAVRELAKFAQGFVFPCIDRGADGIVREMAECSWIKPLCRKGTGNAESFTRWVESQVPKMAKSARYVINQEQFDLLVRRTGQDLLRFWHEDSLGNRSKLSIGAAFRIVDLLFKMIDESESCRFDSVRPFLHVPLGATTLRPIRRIVDELLDRDFAIEIPASVPAGYVSTEELYVLLQEAFSGLAKRASVPPVLYFYWCERA
jgi:hypothetical protein